MEASAQLGQPVPHADSWAREILGDAPASTPPTPEVPAARSQASEVPSPPEPSPAPSGEPACSSLLAALEDWRSTWAIRCQDLPTLKQYAQSVALLGRLVGDVRLDAVDEEAAGQRAEKAREETEKARRRD